MNFLIICLLFLFGITLINSGNGKGTDGCLPAIIGCVVIIGSIIWLIVEITKLIVLH